MIKKQKGFTLIELLLTVMVLGVGIAILLASYKADQKHNEEYKRNNDYKTYCVEGHKYKITENGNSEELLNDNHEPVLCEEETQENSKSKTISNINVNANPYNQQ